MILLPGIDGCGGHVHVLSVDDCRHVLEQTLAVVGGDLDHHRVGGVPILAPIHLDQTLPVAVPQHAKDIAAIEAMNGHSSSSSHVTYDLVSWQGVAAATQLGQELSHSRHPDPWRPARTSGRFRSGLRDLLLVLLEVEHAHRDLMDVDIPVANGSQQIVDPVEVE